MSNGDRQTFERTGLHRRHRLALREISGDIHVGLPDGMVAEQGPGLKQDPGLRCRYGGSSARMLIARCVAAHTGGRHHREPGRLPGLTGVRLALGQRRVRESGQGAT